ncbi:AtpZ/AtpI family protein [Kordia zhangzhouensis]|uniref:AtpZ/AtpI family protein n=1 Tax=Kordia zhangzhouensis TaxID=1620405 RepID=UPI0012FA18F3|nr:AtpZ/AtpI family protein [Kordia zhangzhouensis]
MKEKKPTKQLNKLIRFSGLGIQMGVTFYLAAYFGKKLDTYYGNEKKIITFIFIIIALVATMYSVITQLKKIKD